MRRRKRDWQQKVFKYWTRPTAEADGLPQSFWDHARACQALWNTLVDLRTAAKAEMTEWTDTQKKARWVQLNDERAQAVADSGLDWESGPDILDRFKAACPTKKNPKGDPERRERLDKITMLHRFTGGGSPVATLFSPAAKRIRLGGIPAFAWESESRPNKQRRFTRGQWGLPDGSWFIFDIIMHRPLPPGAIVKRVVWSGRLHRQHGWQWALCILVEEEPVRLMYERNALLTHESDAISGNPLRAGLDLGWRIMAEGSYIRIGMVVDSNEQKIELRLPLAWTTAHEQRHQDRFRTHDKAYIPHSTWRDVQEIDALIGNAVEDCKGQLRQLLPKLPLGFTQMRQHGLSDLMDNVVTLSDNEEQRRALLDVFAAWREKNERLRELKALATDKAIRQRRAMYRQLASWLTQTYPVLVWEGDLSIKEMAEAETGNPILDASMRYRHWAALGELRLYIQQAAKKNECELIGAPAAGSTSTCWRCGGNIVNSEKLLLVCENGHREDQDVNAGRNLRDFSQPSGGAEQKIGLRKNGRKEVIPPLAIPWHLRAVAVSCTVEERL